MATTAGNWDVLIPTKIDNIAGETRDKLYGLWPVAPFSYDAGYRTVTYGNLANAINGLAWWIDNELGSAKDGCILGYVGPNDLRYIALTVAAVKTGSVIFVTSPRNSPAAHRALFEKLQCTTLVTTDPMPPPAAPIVQAVHPRVLTIPSLDEVIHKQHAVYPYHKTLYDAARDPLMVIHTSGSTGIPKPLIWTIQAGANQCRASAVETHQGVQSIESFSRGKRILVTLPPFHGAGVTQYLFHPFSLDTVAIAPTARGIVTAEGLVEALKQAPADVALLVPSVVAELAQQPKLLEYCAKHLQLILYIGGDLPQAIGDLVASKVPLRCQWGASEVGIPPQLMPMNLGPTDWRYIQFHPSAGAKFEQVTDSLYELVFHHLPAYKENQPAFAICGQQELAEYRTRDYFAKHPTIPDVWSWQARADDIIVFLNGEKTNPISFEQQIVAKNPELSGALVVGSQRFQASLILEPANAKDVGSTSERAALIERIWPSVAEANKAAPAYAQVEKPFIMVTSGDRPMIRTGKGTVQRAATVVMYADELEKLYQDAEAVIEEPGNVTHLHDNDAVTSAVRNAILSVTGWPSLGDSESLFSRGLDSLQALGVTRALRREFCFPTFGLSTVYKNPTVEELAAILLERQAPVSNNGPMASLLSTYTGLLKEIPVSKPREYTPDAPVDVLLTGSTGYIGTYLLDTLLRRPSIGIVFCLNRGSDGGRAAQTRRFKASGLDTQHFEGRVSFLHADLSHPKLGLADDTYEELVSRVGLIIHNAWPVNFILELDAFRPQLAGVVNIIALSARAASQILFVSTVAAAGSAVNGQPPPEAIMESLSTPHPNGYAQSKFLSELVLDKASKDLKLAVKIARVGQVAGPVWHRGVWNPREWLPSLAGSSIYLGCVPENLGPQFTVVDWIPSDIVAQVIVELAENTAKFEMGAQVFNLRNPQTTTWAELIPAVQAASQEFSGRPLDIVSPNAWITKLQESVEPVLAAGDMSSVVAAADKNPGIRLYDFYRDSLWSEHGGSPPMSISKAIKASPSLQRLEVVSLGWMKKWLDEWKNTTPVAQR
ncbi:NRPS-like enzyme [Stachybotrys elegans]|uniref:NRPS-like enzyme n=1 Tax=Stachybotrys elegans TaxID=80388 RepID=A0A8K0SKP6_9HYPO|nr:NRPS-like enzyme [Stachybotrys elegans]